MALLALLLWVALIATFTFKGNLTFNGREITSLPARAALTAVLIPIVGCMQWAMGHVFVFLGTFVLSPFTLLY